MANAIKKISVQRGHDVTGYTLRCFGGAGGQHACLVADALGMTRVFVHPLAGVLSAYGMGLADQTRDARAGGRAAARRRAGCGRCGARSTRSARRRRDGAACARASPAARIARRSGACTCATRAPTPRSSSPFGDARRRCARRSRPRTGSASRFLMPERGADRRGGLGRGGRRGRRAGRAGATPRASREAARRSRRPCAMYTRRPLARRRARRARGRCGPGDAIDGPGDHRRGERDHGRRARLAGARSPRSTTCVLDRVAAARRRGARSAPRSIR